MMELISASEHSGMSAEACKAQRRRTVSSDLTRKMSLDILNSDVLSSSVSTAQADLSFTM